MHLSPGVEAVEPVSSLCRACVELCRVVVELLSSQCQGGNMLRRCRGSRLSSVEAVEAVEAGKLPVSYWCRGCQTASFEHHGSRCRNQRTKSPKYRSRTYALDLMSKVLTLLGASIALHGGPKGSHSECRVVSSVSRQCRVVVEVVEVSSLEP